MTGQIEGCHVVHHGEVVDEFSKVPNRLLRDRNVKPLVKLVILWLASQSPDHTVYLTKAADELSMSRKSVTRAVVAGCATPYMWRHDTGRKDKHSNIVWEYHLNVGLRVHRPWDSESTDRGTESPTKKTILEDHIEDKSLSRSAQAQTDGDVAAHHIPADWQPNRTHYASIAKHRLDPDEVLEAFHDSDVVAAEKRTDWDRTFGGFINSFADGGEMRDYGVQY